MVDNMQSNVAQNPPPAAHLVQLAMGGIVSNIVYVAARLGIADHLAASPRTPAEVASAIGAHAPSLYRLMRTLAGFGILTETEGQKFGLTPVGEALVTGAPGAARSTVLTLCGPLFAQGLAELEHSVRTGETGFIKATGMNIFEALAQRPEEAQMFSETMVGFHGAEPPAVAEAYDFSTAGTIVDVGGATGNMLAAILGRHPQPRGVLFDLPHVVTGAPALLEQHGVGTRVSLASGNFFEAVPSGGDAYILSHIIHDWTEEQCLTILRNVRKAMSPSSKLLIVEFVLPTGNAPHPGKVLDMVMLALPGGTERTESEYNALLTKAGFRLNRVVPTASAASIVEALPA
jgi:hypothetical protein